MKINNKNYDLPFIFGLNQSTGKLEIGDFEKVQHTAIFGKSGSGKSCTENMIIQSSMMFNNPISYLMIDLKQVELSQYESFKNVVFADTQEHFLKIVEWLEKETSRRTNLFKKNKVKKLKNYNGMTKNKMPYILVIIDEIAEISLNNQMKDENGKKIDINDRLASLINRTRAVGIFFMIATQKCNNDSIDTNIRSQIETFIYHYFNEKDIRNLGLSNDISKLKIGEFFISDKNYKCDVRFNSLFIDDSKNLDGSYKNQKANILYEKLRKILEVD